MFHTAGLARSATPAACPGWLLAAFQRTMLTDAAEQMHCYQIGALSVYEQHRLIGIVTERDLVAALAEGADPKTTRVADYMTELPATVSPDEDVTVATHRMAELGVRHLPVVDGHRLVGMLSIRDLLLGQVAAARA